MRADTIIFIIIMFVFILGAVMRKLREVIGEQLDTEEGAQADDEAPPEQIKRFLESLGVARPPQAGVDVQAAGAPQRGAVAAEAAEPFVARPEQAQQPFRGAVEGPAAVRVPPREPELKRERRRKVEEPSRRIEAAERKPPREVIAEARKAVAVTPLALRKWDLKQAVAWSEILGRPVGLRRTRRRPPPEER